MATKRLLHLGTSVATGFGREADGNIEQLPPLQQRVAVLTENDVLNTLREIQKKLIDLGTTETLHLGTQMVAEFGMVDELNNVRPVDNVSLTVFRVDEDAFREAFSVIQAKRDELAEALSRG